MHKNRPDWQMGKVNGVGGKIEANEESTDCIVREVQEETGVQTQVENWAYFGEIHGKKWRVDLYAMLYFEATDNFTSTTDEKIEWFNINDLPDNILDNLNWIIPMAINKIKNKEIMSCSVEYE